VRGWFSNDCSDKSVTSANLAVRRIADGYEVLLIDGDDQETTTLWASTRSEINKNIPLNSPRHLFKQYAVIESLAHKVAIVRVSEKLLKFANNNIREIEAGFKGYFKGHNYEKVISINLIKI